MPQRLHLRVVSQTTKFGPTLSWGTDRINLWLLKTIELNKLINLIDTERTKRKYNYKSRQETTWSFKLTKNENEKTTNNIVKIARNSKIENLKKQIMNLKYAIRKEGDNLRKTLDMYPKAWKIVIKLLREIRQESWEYERKMYKTKKRMDNK